MTASTTEIETPYHFTATIPFTDRNRSSLSTKIGNNKKNREFLEKPTKIPKKRQSFDRQDLSCSFCLIQALARANSPLISNPTTKKKYLNLALALLSTLFYQPLIPHENAFWFTPLPRLCGSSSLRSRARTGPYPPVLEAYFCVSFFPRPCRLLLLHLSFCVSLSVVCSCEVLCRAWLYRRTWF